MLNLHREFSFKNKEKLSSAIVGMSSFVCSWWHQFFDNAQFRRFDQMPAFAICTIRPTPFVVLG